MALTTLAKVKQYAEIVSFESDLMLTRLIDSCSTAIERYCSRKFTSQTFTEVRDGTGTAKMTLRNPDVTAVASVKVNGQTIPARTSPTGSGYTHDDLSIRLTGYRFEMGVDNVEVTYTAGFAAVPDDVEQACIDYVTLIFRHRDRIGVSSKTLAGETISFDDDDVPAHVRQVLDQYKMLGL